jgi:hypothetical protein
MEHAILQEITAPLQTLPDDPVASVHADFPVALRGYDRLAVDAYVRQTSQLVAELQATRTPEAAVRKALERVGEQISGILQRAHSTAEEITAQSRAEAEDRLEHARIEAAEIVAGAHQRVKDLDADTDRIWIERQRIVDDARELARQLTVVADEAIARFQEAEPEPEPPAESESEPPAEPEPEPSAQREAYDGEEDPTVVAADDVEDTTVMEAVEPPRDDARPAQDDGGSHPDADGAE